MLIVYLLSIVVPFGAFSCMFLDNPFRVNIVRSLLVSFCPIVNTGASINILYTLIRYKRL